MNRTVIRELSAALRTLGEHGAHLEPIEATPEQLGRIAEAMATARRLLAQADTPPPTTRCRRHPRGPVEPGTTDGCLLCRVARPTATRPAQQPASLDEVREFISEHGEAASTSRYGGPLTTRALKGDRSAPGRSTPWMP
jgi:hypothetical protein